MYQGPRGHFFSIESAAATHEAAAGEQAPTGAAQKECSRFHSKVDNKISSRGCFRRVDQLVLVRDHAGNRSYIRDVCNKFDCFIIFVAL